MALGILDRIAQLRSLVRRVVGTVDFRQKTTKIPSSTAASFVSLLPHVLFLPTSPLPPVSPSLAAGGYLAAAVASTRLSLFIGDPTSEPLQTPPLPLALPNRRPPPPGRGAMATDLATPMPATTIGLAATLARTSISYPDPGQGFKIRYRTLNR